MIRREDPDRPAVDVGTPAAPARLADHDPPALALHRSHATGDYARSVRCLVSNVIGLDPGTLTEIALAAHLGQHELRRGAEADVVRDERARQDAEVLRQAR